MVDRILELMKVKNLTPSQFADEVGIQRSGMSHLISGRNKPSLEFVMKILARFPDVRPDYLLYGTGTPGGDTPRSADSTPVIPVTLFDQPEISEIRHEPKPQRPVKKEKSEKRIEKIVVFYDDKSFREYEPE
jgi:transcriptional regulator with XRE-family HTH domain